MIYRLRRTTTLHASLPAVFEFFKNPSNLNALTPTWLGFRLVSSSDATVRKGTHIRYRLRLAGIPLTWESLITEYQENSHFSDKQLTGPYTRWYHRHVFRAVGNRVEMTDDVEYQLPIGLLGR